MCHLPCQIEHAEESRNGRWWRCVGRISNSSSPTAVRGAPEGGEGERGRVATGGATTAGSGGGDGVGRQERGRVSE